MLDHQQGVAERGEFSEGFEQPAVVPRVKADARLVEDVHDPGEAGSYLGGEADPLRFATRKRVGAAVESEVVETDESKETEA